ncbi:MAG: hypothetical protein IPI60_08875 [Saprospiraceae bacterium]|nr:hypothetical protein [Saprospiraceae bacterium]
MFKWLIRLLIFVLIILIGYNYFFGNKEEKETSEAIVTQVKSLGKSLGGVLKSEKEKFDAGKYDEALDKVGNFITGMKKNADKLDSAQLKQLKELEAKQELMQKHLDENKDSEDNLSKADKEALQKELQDIIREMDDLLKSTEEE